MEFDLEKFKENPKDYLKKSKLPTIFEFLEKANYYYRNTDTTLINDDLYDFIYDYAQRKDPKNPFFKNIGALPAERKVELPIWMGSQDKIRDDPKNLEKWKAKYNPPYVLTDKLDGNSGLFVYDKKKQITLYTRGDGTHGQNVTQVLKYITKKDWQMEQPVMVRGEFIISKKNWEKIKDKGANARNVTAGILNSKTVDPNIAKYMDFVAYELLEPKLEFQEGLEVMKGYGFTVVEYDIVDKDMLTTDYLSNYLIKRREQSPYEIDGIVVRDNEFHPIVKGKNPKYSFAFKTILTHEEAEVLVTQVEWNVSKDGYLKPLVHFNPVHIAGVKIQKATGFNASFIQEHKIGPGSKIVIIRSGDVIPHIVRILTPSMDGKPSFPKLPYEWNETGVDIQVLKDSTNEQQQLRQMEHFVNTLDIQNIGSGVLKKMIEKGIDTIPKLVALKKADFLTLESVKEKGAEKMYESLNQRLKTVTCEELMAASNLFGRGFGLKKLKVITEAYPEILKQKEIKELKPIKGIGETTINQFLKELPTFYKFLKEIGFKCQRTSKRISGDKLFEGKSIVFTGFRNKDWEKAIELNGGKVSSSISKNTFLVVAADITESSSKVEKGRELGILISKDEFAKRYTFT